MQNELEILREFYETVKSQNVGVGAYFLTFSNKVKDALDVCSEKLAHLTKRASDGAYCDCKNPMFEDGFRCSRCGRPPSPRA